MPAHRPILQMDEAITRGGEGTCAKPARVVLTETGPGPGPGPLPLPSTTAQPHPPAPEQSSLKCQHGCRDMELSINYYFMLETKKQMLHPYKHQQSLPGVVEVKGQGEKGGMWSFLTPASPLKPAKPRPSINWFPLPPSQPQRHHLPGCCRGSAPSTEWPVPPQSLPFIV